MALRLLSAAVLALGAVSWPAAVSAEPPPGSAVSQYVEVIPSATGGTVPGASSTSAGTAAPSAPVAVVLAPVAQKALARQPERQRKVLRDVATSPAYGAPRSKLPKQATQREALPAGVLPSPKALAQSGGPELPILLLVVLGTAAAAGGWAYARSRR